ncbi:MAG: hydroxyacylglutathione hydrolase [Mariprofundales bacterium]
MEKTAFCYHHDAFDVYQLPVLRDNYIYLIANGMHRETLVVDPAQADGVAEVCVQYDLTPVAILNTHHHWDHTDGNLPLKQQFSLEVVASATCHAAGKTKDSDACMILAGLEIETLSLPGHTLDHVAYRIGDAVFCGDALFGAGCGRIFEGSQAQMWQSLQLLAALPEETKVYCAHEYTLANLQFARKVDEDNSDLIARSERDKSLRRAGKPTIPSTIGRELATNPFLRPLNLAFCYRYAERHGIDANPLAVFTHLRAAKDRG